MFCKYKELLGKVGKGVHSIRLFNIAVIDVLLTFIAAYIIYSFNNKNNYFLILILLFIAGIILHRLFCVRTTIDKLLFD